MSASTTVVAVISGKAVTSGQRDILSIIVWQYLFPPETGNDMFEVF